MSIIYFESLNSNQLLPSNYLVWQSLWYIRYLPPAPAILLPSPLRLNLLLYFLKENSRANLINNKSLTSHLSPLLTHCKFLSGISDKREEVRAEMLKIDVIRNKFIKIICEL